MTWVFWGVTAVTGLLQGCYICVINVLYMCYRPPSISQIEICGDLIFDKKIFVEDI